MSVVIPAHLDVDEVVGVGAVADGDHLRAGEVLDNPNEILTAAVRQPIHPTPWL